MSVCDSPEQTVSSSLQMFSSFIANLFFALNFLMLIFLHICEMIKDRNLASTSFYILSKSFFPCHHKVENELENYKELKRTKENIFLREVFPLKVENEFGHDTLIVENYEEFKRTMVKLGRI